MSDDLGLVCPSPLLVLILLVGPQMEGDSGAAYVTSRPGARPRPTLSRSGPTYVATCLSFRSRFAQNG
jgi:hypothetical protein